MAWPSNVSPVGTENDTDTLTDARENINASIDAVNDIIDSRNVASGVPSLDASVKVTEVQLRQITIPVVKQANFTTAAIDLARIFVCEGPITATIDDTISGVGTWHVIKNGNQGTTDDVVIITISGGSDIEGNTSISLRPGDGVTIVRGTSRWYAEGSFRQSEVTGTGWRSRQFAYFNNVVYDTLTVWNDVSADLTEATWESVGPTGSGADYVWDALDDVPRVDGFILVNAFAVASATASGEIAVALNGREYGSSQATSDSNYVAKFNVYNDTSFFSRHVSQRWLPIDSNGRFELNWSEDANNASTNISLSLAGFMV